MCVYLVVDCTVDVVVVVRLYEANVVGRLHGWAIVEVKTGLRIHVVSGSVVQVLTTYPVGSVWVPCEVVVVLDM